MTLQSAGPALVLAGVALVVIGLLAWTGGLSWFGHLPGDIRIERPNVSIYVPITSMLVVSVALSVLAFLAHKLLGG